MWLRVTGPAVSQCQGPHAGKTALFGTFEKLCILDVLLEKYTDVMFFFHFALYS